VALLKGLQRDVHEVFAGAVKERRAGRLNGPEEELFSGSFWSAPRARDLGLLDDATIDRASHQWVSERADPPPRFLRVSSERRRLEADVSISALFSPLVSVTQFAPIDSISSVPIRPVIQAIDELNRLVRGMRTHDWVAPQDPGSRQLVAFLGADGFAPYNYTPYQIIRRYFDEALVPADRGYMVPRSDNPDSWEGLGIVLAHVGAMGCHCLLERPLDPLLWAALRGDPLSSYSPELIEEYLLETDRDWLRSRRVEATHEFHKGDSDCVARYRQALLGYWRRHLARMLPICEAVRRGFARLTGAKTSDEKLAHLGSQFQKFHAQICQMEIPAIRLWFEGLRMGDKPWKQGFLDNVEFKAYKPADRRWQIDDHEVAEFVHNFLEWVNWSEDALAFIVALCGVTGLLPLKTLSHRFIIMADARAANARRVDAVKPNILMPKQRRLMYVVRDWGLFQTLPREIASGRIQIGAVGKEELFNHIKIGKIPVH
jgi:hypothetical protein